MATEENNTQTGNYEKFLEILGSEQLQDQALLDQVQLFCDTFPQMSDPYWLLSIMNEGMLATDGRHVEGVAGLWGRMQEDYSSRNGSVILPRSDIEQACSRIFAIIQYRIANPLINRKQEKRDYRTAAESAAQAEMQAMQAELENMAARVRELLQEQANDPRDAQINTLREQLRRSGEALDRMRQESERKDRQIAELLARLRQQGGPTATSPGNTPPETERKVPDYDYLTIFGLDKEWFYKVPGGKNKTPGQQEKKVLKTDDEIKKDLRSLRSKIVLTFDSRAITAMQKVDPYFADAMDKMVKTANAAYNTLSKSDTRKIYLELHGITLD